MKSYWGLKGETGHSSRVTVRFNSVYLDRNGLGGGGDANGPTLEPWKMLSLSREFASWVYP